MRVWMIRKLAKMPPLIAGGQPTLFYEPVSGAEPWFTSEAQAVRAMNGLARVMNNVGLVTLTFEVEDGPTARPGEGATGVGKKKEADGDRRLAGD